MRVKEIVILIAIIVIIAGGGIFYFTYNSGTTESNSYTTKENNQIVTTPNITTNNGITNTDEIGKNESANNYKTVKIRVPNYMCIMIYSAEDESPYYTIFSLNTGVYDVQVMDSSSDWCYIKINSEDVEGYVLTSSLKYMEKSYDESQTNKEEAVPDTSTYFPQTVIKDNSSEISDTAVASLMKQWITTSQYNYSDFEDRNGTAWANEWFSKVSNSELVTAFKDANGSEALSGDIKAYELNKAAMLLTETRVKNNDVPFTTNQATTLIKKMLAKAYPDEVVTKVELNSSEGLYYVYTKGGGDSNPSWYINIYTGYCTGI